MFDVWECRDIYLHWEVADAVLSSLEWFAVVFEEKGRVSSSTLKFQLSVTVVVKGSEKTHLPPSPATSSIDIAAWSYRTCELWFKIWYSTRGWINYLVDWRKMYDNYSIFILSMIYKGHRKIGLVMAPTFWGKISGVLAKSTVFITGESDWQVAWFNGPYFCQSCPG